MKKIIAFILVAVLLLPLAACGGNAASYDAEVQLALRTLKEHWATKLEHLKNNDGVLTIKDTRVIVFEKDYQNNVDADVPSDVLYIVEFVLFTNYFDAFYGENPLCTHNSISESVVIYKDGKVEVPAASLLNVFFAKYFIFDYTGIIKDVVELGTAYNRTIKLK